MAADEVHTPVRKDSDPEGLYDATPPGTPKLASTKGSSETPVASQSVTVARQSPMDDRRGSQATISTDEQASTPVSGRKKKKGLSHTQRRKAQKEAQKEKARAEAEAEALRDGEEAEQSGLDTSNHDTATPNTGTQAASDIQGTPSIPRNRIVFDPDDECKLAATSGLNQCRK